MPCNPLVAYPHTSDLFIPSPHKYSTGQILNHNCAVTQQVATMIKVHCCVGKGGGTGEARGALAPPIFDFCMRTLRTDNRLLRSLSRQPPPPSYFCSATTVCRHVCIHTSTPPRSFHNQTGVISQQNFVWLIFNYHFLVFVSL